jgi:hypothetical protein
VYCESGETSKKLRTHSKRKNHALGFDSERLTRLFGAGAPFRPLFCPIPSNLFWDRRIPIPPTIRTKSLKFRWLLLLGENTPEQTVSIEKQEDSVKPLWPQGGGKRCGKVGIGTSLAYSALAPPHLLEK